MKSKKPILEKLSEDMWKQIKFNQQFPLVGENIPNDKMNGFHDSISWERNFFDKRSTDDEVHSNPFYTIYLRDLDHLIDPSAYSRRDNFKEGFKIKNASSNYIETFNKYLIGDSRYSNNIQGILSDWSRLLTIQGRVIFEIIGWYDNKSSQLYGFEVRELDPKSCFIIFNQIFYKAPIQKKKVTYKWIRIPRKKCIIIDFPKSHGGYVGFKEKKRKVKKLGQKFIVDDDPSKNMRHSINWDKEFNRLISDWGTIAEVEGINEFYQVLLSLRFKHLALKCTNEILEGVNQLILFLNARLKEKAKMEFKIQSFDEHFLLESIKKWQNGELPYSEARAIINS